ncbi:glycosyltransferase [Neobacillus cucumis]|uniref:Glycosyl transferase family 1 domain-containing protein n=1 Tax=Neobacillus cucumis TaxID=1740721 RepID=A0A2N5H7N2_9BACI|nr:glycosyltransferase [Neobacillus cucumis]PLS01513.1 hypothetical protein CVD27_24980 [Neobacillus cucumis]
MKKIAIIINSNRGSALCQRAKGLFSNLENEYSIYYLYRNGNRLQSIYSFLKELYELKPDIMYVLDTAIPGATSAIIYKLFFNTSYIIDTGDLGYELAVTRGRPSWIGRKIIKFVEDKVIKLSDRIVVRGTFHKSLLNSLGYKNVNVIRDGINISSSKPEDVGFLRNDLGLENSLCVGLIGTLRYNKRYQMCYGWDLIESMSFINKNIPVRGVIIGDGDGLDFLKKRVQELNIKDRIVFLGRVPYESLNKYTNLLDIAISTQTNNNVGNVRTTGKLAEYMAAGRFIISTDVGEAKVLLPQEMRLPYNGIKDKDYPKRLAKKIEDLYYQGMNTIYEMGNKNIKIAQKELDYKFLSSQVQVILNNFKL